MESAQPSDEEIFGSTEYQQYLLILDEYTAYYYGRDEIVAQRERAMLLAPTPPPFRDWYQEYLQSPEWRERAEATYTRFGDRCPLCNAPGPLHAHHRTYERVGDESLEDLTALCAACHEGYHKWRRGAPPD